MLDSNAPGFARCVDSQGTYLATIDQTLSHAVFLQNLHDTINGKPLGDAVQGNGGSLAV